MKLSQCSSCVIVLPLCLRVDGTTHMVLVVDGTFYIDIDLLYTYCILCID